MVRNRLLIVIGLLLLCAAGVLAGSWWLLATSQGQRWLLAEITRRTAITIEAGRVEGRLLDHLRLTDVIVNWPDGEARCATFELRWRPLALLHGQLAIDDLAVTQARISWLASADAVEEPTAALAWPRLEGWPLRLRASVATLRLEEIVVQPPTGAAHSLDSLAARLEWRRGIFAVEELAAVMDGYRLHGLAAVGLDRPLLNLDLRLALPAATAGIDQLKLQADLAPAPARLMAGPFTLHAGSDTQPTLQLSGELALDSTALALQPFTLTQEGQPGSLHGTATVALRAGTARWHLQVTLADLDLAAQTGMTTALHGTIDASGSGTDYRGEFEVVNRTPGWTGARLAGPFAGDAAAIAFPALDGSWLDGQLSGELRLSWAEGVSLVGTLSGRHLDPAAITPEWPGRVNFDLKGELARSPAAPLRAHLQGRLLDSILRGMALTGSIDATMAGDDLRLAAVELHGDGFDLSAQGRLQDRLEFRAAVSHLAGLVPAAQGALTATGWLRWRDGIVAGALDGHARQLAYAGLQVETLRLIASLPVGAPAGTLQLTGSGLAFRDWQVQQLALQIAGSLPEHALDLQARWSRGELQAAAMGGWHDSRWAGRLTRLNGRDDAAGPWRLLAPANFEIAADHLRLDTLQLAGSGAEALQLDADLTWQPWQGAAAVQWQNLDLARLNPWLAPAVLSGRSGGSVSMYLQPDGAFDLAGRLEGSGQVQYDALQLAIRLAASEFAWDTEGLRASIATELEGGGRLRARLNSVQPGRAALPQQGHFSAEWADLDLTRLAPWLPEGIDLAGRMRGTAAAQWFPGWRLEMTGQTAIDAGRLAWRSEDGELTADLRAASLDWDWREAALSGGLQLVLAEYGEARGSFRLPLPAQLPVVMNPRGPLQLALTAKVREHGLLTAFFPGLILASRGELEVQAKAGGTWQNPDLGGSVRLSGAGADFPAAGIELKDVALSGTLAGDELRIASFTARSGNGRLRGSGSVRLQNWRPVAYRGALSGENFAAVQLPELQLLISPEVTMEGTPERLQVRGEIRIPELIVLGREQRGVVRESPDVIIVGAQAEAAPSFPFALDLRVQITLGERVLVKTAGVDARLVGGVEVRISAADEITANGEVQVAQGIYSTYGVQLKIERGRLLYSGGPIDQPTFDIQALRTIGEVKAGVQLGGTPRTPVVRLYSEPAMPDTDVLAYIVLGHPLGTGSGELSLLSAAAGALLSHGQSVTLQDQLKRQLGIDVIAIEDTGDVAGSMVTIGKYLSPKLYLSFGQALFTNASEARLRYSITPKWQLESRTTGETSGVDLFYLIEMK
jgi:translocation and assembly module TamB